VPGFKPWATSSQSVVVRDNTLTFESDVLKEAQVEWTRQAAGRIPQRRNFTPRSVRAFVGNLVIFERHEAADYFVRLMGTRIAGVLGEMQGKALGEALPSDVARRWSLALDEVLRTRTPARIVNTVSFDNLDFLEAEVFLAPLLDERGEPTMVFAVVAFRSGVSKGPSLNELVEHARNGDKK
jgi:hypothetical protein